jgi:hypothetical protein
MTDRELAGCARLGQQADPPHMIQPPGCNYTPDEVGRMLGNRVVQPHYAAWLVRKALLNIGLIDAEAARQQHAADQATIAALREELNRRAPSSGGDAVEQLTESEKDVALGQAVEFAEYVERQAKGAMRDAANRFLSLPYALEIAARLDAAHLANP